MEFKSKSDLIRHWIKTGEATTQYLYSKFDEYKKICESNNLQIINLNNYKRRCRKLLHQYNIENSSNNLVKAVNNEFDTPNMSIKKVWGKPGNYQISLEKDQVSIIDFEEIKKDIIDSLPKTNKKIKYKNVKEKFLYEVCVFDHHLGSMIIKNEEIIYDIKKAKELMLNAVVKLMSLVKNFSIDRILLPIGNDFFNIDTTSYTTTAGTKQDEFPSWKLSFIEGRRLIMDIISQLTYYAPVDVIIIPGNHDTMRTFCLGDLLDVCYQNNPNVTVNNSFFSRKYYQYGKVLLGFTHGNNEIKNSRSTLMALEVPKLWAATKHREWQLGHLHHSKTKELMLNDEYMSVREVFLPSLVPINDWHNKKGYIHLQQSIGKLWHIEDCAIGEFYYNA